MKNDSLKTIWSEITGAKSILMPTHLGADADSAGSILALAEVLNNVTLVSSEPLGQYLKNVIDTSKIIEESDPASMDLSKYDLFLALDIADKTRFSLDKEFDITKSLKTINVDHHVTNPHWANLNYVDTKSPSTATIIYEMLKENNIEITEKVATYLLAGILGDTGRFAYIATRAQDLRIAADLMDKGANLFELNWNATFNTDPDQYKIQALIYKNLKVSGDSKYAYTTVSIQEKKDAGIPFEKDFPTSADFIKEIKGVDFVFSIYEKKPGEFKASFRAHTPEFDTTRLSRPLGGGGHAPASGADLIGATTIDEALKKVIEHIDQL